MSPFIKNATEAPRNGPYCNSAGKSFARTTDAPNNSLAARSPRLRQQNKEEPPRRLVGTVADPTVLGETGTGYFSEAYIEGRGVNYTDRRSPFTAMDWPDNIDRVPSTRWDGGGVDSGIPFDRFAEAGRFEQMSARRSTERNFVRHSSQMPVDNKNRFINHPPSGYGSTFEQNFDGGRGGGFKYYPITFVTRDDIPSGPTPQKRSRKVSSASAWGERLRQDHQQEWTCDPFIPDIGAVGGSPRYYPVTTREQAHENLDIGFNERCLHNPPPRGTSRNNLFSGEVTSRAGSGQEKASSDSRDHGKRRAFWSPTTVSNRSNLRSASYIEERYTNPPVMSCPSPKRKCHGGWHRDSQGDHESLKVSRRRSSAGSSRAFSERRYFRPVEDPNGSNKRRIPTVGWSKGGAEERAARSGGVYNSRRWGTAPAAMAMDVLVEGNGQPDCPIYARQELKHGTWRFRDDDLHGVPHLNRDRDEEALEKGKSGPRPVRRDQRASSPGGEYLQVDCQLKNF